MRQLRILFLGVIGLTFVAGMGAGAYVGSLAAAPRRADGVDRRVRDFQRHFDLTATQLRQLREILAEHDRADRDIRRLTPEQFRELEDLRGRSRARIRRILTPEQRTEYDRLAGNS